MHTKKGISQGVPISCYSLGGRSWTYKAQSPPMGFEMLGIMTSGMPILGSKDI